MSNLSDPSPPINNPESVRPHTPGPWRPQLGPCGTRMGVMGPHGPVAMLGVAAALNPADVRLIAAAPELLAALEQSVRFIRNGLEFGYIRLAAGDPGRSLPDILEAAIARAKGGDHAG